MVGGESDSIANICCKNKIDYALPYFSRDTKSLESFPPAKISDFCYTMKIFERTVESELEDASGEYATAAEKNSDRRADAVRDVTPLKCQFLGARMETKNCNHAQRDMEEPMQLPRVRASDKNTLRNCITRM